MNSALSALMLFVIAISGCSSMNKRIESRFEPYKSANGQQEFKFFAHSNRFSPEYDKDSENERMEWLQTWLTDNKMCPNGYVITQRTVVDVGLGDAVKDIYYYGKCK